MSWIILRTMSGERFLCQIHQDEMVGDVDVALVNAVRERVAIKITEVYGVSTMNVLTGGMPARITALEYPDLQQEEPIDHMYVIPAAWYKFPEERAREEIEEMKESMKQAREYREREESRIAQAQLAGIPGMGGPGGLITP